LLITLIEAVSGVLTRGKMFGRAEMPSVKFTLETLFMQELGFDGAA
jgi:hypothetical protein